MLRVVFLIVLFSVGVLLPVGADTDRVSAWLIKDRQELVENSRTVKLAILCQRWPLRLDRDAFEFIMQQRAHVSAPLDRKYAAAAIREGEDLALVDYKYAAANTCAALVPAELSVAANYLTGRISLRATTRTH